MREYLFINLIVASALAKLIVYSPKSLTNQFLSKNDTVSMSVSNFGHIPWGHKIQGTVVAADPIDGCSELTTNFTVKSKSNILIMERGTCDFTVKVLNAQKVGAKLAIIVDNLIDEAPDEIIMADDGRGFLVKIPSILIGKKDGDQIINYLDNQHIQLEQNITSEPVVVIVQFETSIQKNTTVDLAISITNRDSYKLIRTFKKHYEVLKKAGVTFDVYYDIFPCIDCVEEEIVSNCLGGGWYCDIVPEQDEVSNGHDVLYEILRGLCIWQIDQDSWWDYMSKFDQQCLHPTEYSQCSRHIISKLEINDFKVTECVEGSFNSSSSLDREQQENFLLLSQLQFKNSSGIIFYPGALINNQPYLGNVDAKDLLEEICNSMVDQPRECKPYVEGYQSKEGEEESETLEFIGNILIMVFIMFMMFGLIFFCYKRMLIKEKQEESSQQVGQQVAQYIQFYESKDRKKDQQEQL